MTEEKYIYGVILTDKEIDFGTVGLGGESVTTIGRNGLACVVSEARDEEYSLADKAHLKAHEIVLETVMQDYPMLPIRFGSVAPSTKAVKLFLKNHNNDFKRLFQKINGKVEIELELFWKNMKGIWEEIVQESQKLRALKASPKKRSQEELIMAGQLVAAHLRQKKEKEGLKYMKLLKGTFADLQKNATPKDEMILYGSFLVAKEKLHAFDQAVEQLEAQNRERIHVRTIGPMPPYSFTSVRM